MQSAGSEIITYSHRKRHLIDRLSALPDDIICRILFFLQTRESVATSILARRWRFLWAYVPKLCFVVDIFYLRTSFSDIVNKVMPLHKLQSLEEFGLCEDYKSGLSEYQLESWITTAIDRNVQRLGLGFDPQRSFKLPQCLFSCKTVVDMGLFRCGGIPLASSGAIQLPNLKKLHLEDVDYEVEEALPRLLSGCPVLEELTVVGIGRLLGCLDISSPTVKTLKLIHESRTDIFDNPDNDRVLINAPALRYLELGCRYDNISFSSITTSLVEVVIELNTYMFGALDYFYARCHVLKFLDSVCNIKRLKVINNFKEIIEFGVVDSNVRFNNLVKLDLNADSQFLSKFIGGANELGVHKGYECLKTLMEPVEEECACLLHSFRNVTIHQFGCTEQEINTIIYILSNARGLKLKIHSRHDFTLLPKLNDILRKLDSKEREPSVS